MDSSSRSQSHYERKLARQRQLELMEAAASGTAPPTMSLDTSSFAETDGSLHSVRKRESSAARRFLQEDESEEEINFLSPSQRNVGSLFRSQDPYSLQQVNLMDHDAGVYGSSSSGRWNSVVNSVKKLFVSEHDASLPEADVFVSEAGYQPSRKRVSSLTSACRATLQNRKRVRYTTFAVVAFLIVLISLVVFKRTHPSKKVVWTRNTVRFNEILDSIVMLGISNTEVFLDYSTAEYHALRWVTYSDPAHLDPDDPVILERYALAVFYYSSYIAYTKIAGQQTPIEFDNQQYEGVPNPGWMRKDYWLSEKGVCMWWGVRCEPIMRDGNTVERYDANAHVLSLNLTNNHMHGILPPEFKGLEYLTSLDFSNNKLQGSIPTQMGYLPEIQYLYLNRNQLTGTLPTELGSLETIRSIHIGYNNFTGTLPSEWSRMTNLRGLSLENNRLTGTIPDLSGCSKMTVVYLDNNQFNGFFPFGFAKMVSLFELRLQYNELTGTLHAELETLRHLEVFQVDHNKLTGPIPFKWLDRMSNLRTFILDNNQLTGDLPYATGSSGARRLRTLQLAYNQLSGTIPAEWNSFSTLEILHIQGNQIKGNLPSGLNSARLLKEFWAQENRFDGSVPPELGEWQLVESVYLDNNKFTGTLPSTFGKMDKLVALRLNNNFMGGHVPSEVCDLKTAGRLKYIKTDCSVACKCCNNNC